MKYPWEKEYSISLKMLLKIYVSTHLNLSLDHLSVQVGLGLIKPLSGKGGECDVEHLESEIGDVQMYIWSI